MFFNRFFIKYIFLKRKISSKNNWVEIVDLDTELY